MALLRVALWLLTLGAVLLAMSVVQERAIGSLAQTFRG
jgi:HAMP domain-containing protein